MKIKRSIILQLRQYGINRNLYQIRLRTNFNGQRLDLKTGCQINNAAFWDKDNQFVHKSYVGPKGESAADINNELRNAKDQMDTVFKYFEAIDTFPTLEQVKEKYLERMTGTVPQPSAEKKVKGSRESSLFSYFDIFVRESGEKNAWSDATFEKMAALREDLHTFNKSIKLSDLTENVLTDFVAYLRDKKKLRTPRKAKGDRESYDEEDIVGLKNSTIEKKLGYLKWFLKWATIKGYNTNMAYKSFRPTLKQTQKKVIYLTQTELKQLINMEFSDSTIYLESVRDVFLFCCFSGLRHSDVCNLRKSDIKKDHIEITTVKTADSVIIELNDITSAILDKYKEIDFPGDKALPSLANQNFNRDLKKLCKLAGINEEIRLTTYKGNERKDEIKQKWELVGSHCGRRTFIVNALSLGIAPNVVMKWTGHNDYKSMKPYIDIVDSIRAAEMTKFNSIISKI